ncbi:putative beta-glucosidase [Aureobasidium sp. EXF-3400]|nr:putative beta-glucosidase [Aureobasidium sp. EXF-12344]KAI4770058.1 putative beta-glucosidase [Aureobasidium sp. EXF-3400]
MHAKSFCRLFAGLLLIWTYGSAIVSAQSTTQPSLAQITSALASAAGPGTGATSLGSVLTEAGSTLEGFISDTIAQLAKWTTLILFPERYYSYGRSPPVYPSPQGQGSGDWSQAYSQAKALVAQMTVQEKANITLGSSETHSCSGFTGSVPRLGFPGMCLNDAESGVRTASKVNGYPAQLHIGASWNRSLAYDRAYHIGREFKTKGVNVLLGPVAGPLGRIATGGRNWEGFSNDPYLSGSLIAPTIQGMQRSVIACVKHFIANEQETNRSPFLQGFISGLINLNNSVSSNLDDRTMHELYLWPFYDAVKAGAGSTMCSYQRVNNSYACQNSKTMNGLLKTELGFEGFVLSDWYAQHTGVASVNAGLDMVMPSSMYLDINSFATAVRNGSINSTRLDDMATRILATWYRFANLSNPGLNDADARQAESEATLFQGAIEGHVLVKNLNNALPLSKPKVLSLFGYDAPGGINTSATDSQLYQQGKLNTQAFTNGKPYTDLDDLIYSAQVLPAGFSGPEVALNGTLYTGGGSGAITPMSSISLEDAFRQQAAIDGTILYTEFTSQNPTVKDPNNPCLVFINSQSSEGWDRSTLADVYSDTLVTNVASQCNNTMVFIHSAGVRLVDRWIEHPNITAVIYANLPGQYSGNSLTEIVYGRQSPSGRLPFTVAKNESDYGSLLRPTLPDRSNPQYSQSDFTEGLFIDYKHFIQQNITPRFAFGYGLTYSSFNYSSLSISVNASAIRSSAPPGSTTSIAAEGGTASLYDNIATISVSVENTGSFAAAEVAQLYIGVPGSGVPKVLRGFEKQLIQPGASAAMTFPLRRRDLSIWDVKSQQWMLPSGDFVVMVGKSVLDIQVQGTLTL